MKRVTFLFDYKHGLNEFMADDSLSLDDQLATDLYNAGVVSINGESLPVPDKPQKLTVDNTGSTNVVS